MHDKGFMPGPGVNQPKHGFTTLRNTGGGFNTAKSKTYIAQHVYDKKDIPGPSDNQPKHGHFAHSIAKKTHTDNRNAPGGVDKSKSKTYIAQMVYDKKDIPGPGVNQPKHGFTTLATSGGNFNQSKPKSYIDEHIYSKKDNPGPSDNQPKHGHFSESISKQTAAGAGGGGRFNEARSKNYIEQHVYDKKDVPAPTDNQPTHGSYAHSMAAKTDATNPNGARGGTMSKSKPMSSIEHHVYMKRHVPAPGSAQPKHGNFSTSISTTASAEVGTGGGFSKHKPKGFIDDAVWRKSHVPAPTDSQPDGGNFSHSISTRTDPENRNGPGGGFNTAKSKTFIEQAVYDARHNPGPGHCQPRNGPEKKLKEGVNAVMAVVKMQGVLKMMANKKLLARK